MPNNGIFASIMGHNSGRRGPISNSPEIMWQQVFLPSFVKSVNIPIVDGRTTDDGPQPTII